MPTVVTFYAPTVEATIVHLQPTLVLWCDL